jgi:hypothetical protein
VSTEDQKHDDVLKDNTNAPQISVGMYVTSIDGEQIGRVKQLAAEEFLLDRRFAHDLWVPLRFILATEDYGSSFHGPVQRSSVVLSVSSAHIDSQGWRHA